MFNVEKVFTYHPPHGTQPQRYVAIRTTAKDLARLIQTSCPDSREKSLALTNLQQTVMWANASIAINEPAPPAPPAETAPADATTEAR